MSGQPDRGRLVTAAELLADAQRHLDELPASEQAHADQWAEALRALFALRALPVAEPVLLGFAAGVAEFSRLLSELGAHADRRTWEQLRGDLLLLVGRLAQASVPPATLHGLIDDQPPAGGGR